ncbi:MAG: PilZ domain-containing protein [Humidesulfovibrio sp.]|uniref:PilZ domain-containing protein n=1 Tax=Humidesulfovibrio sp. TaxID=2910988 RepID=UPI002734146A|nr:PilZ domain-containing protein [Humidesulfovibrio sp.]MDP2849414.1 PilZ domain-containing protein [Humidesulfovibrio sp.]
MTEARRREKRLDVESVVLPFLGSRAADYQTFEYLLQDVSPGGVGLSLPRWLSARELLRQGERVHLHLPFELAGKMLQSGLVSWARWDEEQEAQLVGVVLDAAAPSLYPVFVSMATQEIAIDLAGFTGLEHILARVLKDCVLLKRGILVYLKHLSAYFSRVCDLGREEYLLFREVIMDEVRRNVETHLKVLEGMLRQAEENGALALERLDLDELRRAMDPELYIDMFSAALGDETVGLFLKAVKELERKLLSNYNTSVLLYINVL